MKLLLLIALHCMHSQAQFTEFKLYNDTQHQIADSLVYIVENFYRKHSSFFVLILSCESSATMHFFSDLLLDFLSHLRDIKAEIFINSFGDNSPAQPGDRMYNLILVDSLESFLKIDFASKVQNYDENEYYHIFVYSQDKQLDKEIQKMFEYCWDHYIINVNIQVEMSSGDIVIYTYFPFTKLHCRKVVPVEINHFHDGIMENENFFPQKLLNMFNCPVRIATWNTAPYIIFNLSKTGSNYIDGSEGKLVTQLSELMNFRIEIIEPPNREQRGIITGNKTTGAVRMLNNKEADLSLGNFWYSPARAEVLTPSLFHYQVANGAFFLTNPSYYSPIQALWFPFQIEASMALVLAFFGTLAIIFCIPKLMGKYCLPMEQQRQVCLNFLACTLGLPSFEATSSSWRIFVVTWTLFTLVIRAVYGAIIYHFMRNNLFRTTPSTLSEIVQLDYTCAVGLTPYRALAETSLFTDTGLKTLILDNSLDLYKFVEDNEDKRLVTVAPIEGMLYFLDKGRKFGKLSMLKESFLNQNSCIFFTKHSFFVDRVNILIKRIKSVGLVDAWINGFLDFSYLKAKRQLQVTIGQNELKAVYYFCGLMLLASFVVFGLEVASIRVGFLRKAFD